MEYDDGARRPVRSHLLKGEWERLPVPPSSIP